MVNLVLYSDALVSDGVLDCFNPQLCEGQGNSLNWPC